MVGAAMWTGRRVPGSDDTHWPAPFQEGPRHARLRCMLDTQVLLHLRLVLRAGAAVPQP